MRRPHSAASPTGSLTAVGDKTIASSATPKQPTKELKSDRARTTARKLLSSDQGGIMESDYYMFSILTHFPALGTLPGPPMAVSKYQPGGTALGFAGMSALTLQVSLPTYSVSASSRTM